MEPTKGSLLKEDFLSETLLYWAPRWEGIFEVFVEDGNLSRLLPARALHGPPFDARIWWLEKSI